jgi:hypothetical protein
MQTKFIAAIVASGCLMGLQTLAFAEDAAAHSAGAVAIRTSSHVRAHPAPQYYDQYGRDNLQGRSSQCDGTYDLYNGTCYPLDIPAPTGR